MRLQTKIILGIMPVILAAILFLALWSAKSLTHEVKRNFYYQMDVAIQAFIHEHLAHRNGILAESDHLQYPANVIEWYKNKILPHAYAHLLNSEDIFLVIDSNGEPLTTTADEDNSRVLYQELLRDQEGAGTQEGTKQKGTVVWNNKLMLYSIASFTPWQWKLVYLRQTTELQRKIREIYQVYALSAGLVVLAVSLIVFFILRVFFIRPVMLLNEATEKIGCNSNLGNIALHSGDELGLLARKIEKMEKRLHEYDNDQERLKADAMDTKERLQLIIDSANIGTWEWNLQSGSLEINRRWAEMVGYELDDFKPKLSAWQSLVHPDDYQHVVDQMNQHITGDKPAFTAEYRLKHRKGHWIWVLAVGRVLVRDEAGREVRAVGIHIDISKQKESEETLRSAMVNAESANKTKLAFLSNMSHELRTPLNAILGYAELLKIDPTLGEKQLSGIETIYQSGDHLLMLINDILDLSQIESGNLELVEREFSFEPFLTSIRDIISIRSNEKGLKFNFEPAAELPEIIVADDLRLRQVLLNLLTNAVKFTKKGYCTFRVESSTTAPGQVRLTFAVEDSGPGIGEDMQRKVFEPFQQNEQRLRYTEGSGLGLSISLYLVRQMGGELLLISPVHDHREGGYGPGCCFSFSLSCQTMQDRQPDRLHEDQQTKVVVNGGHKKILLVDARQSNQIKIHDCLVPLGFELKVEESAENIIGVCHTYQPDLILLDMTTSVVDGFAALTKVKADAALSSVPVVAISTASFDQNGLSPKGSDSGFSGFFSKPYNPDYLITLLAQLLKLGSVTVARSSEENAVEKLRTPPREVIRVFQASLDEGNIDAIIKQADDLEQQHNGEYAGFARKIKRYAVNVQLAGIESMLKKRSRE